MSPKVMESGEQLHEPSAIEPLGDAVERGLEAVLHGGHTLLRRRVWSKPGAGNCLRPPSGRSAMIVHTATGTRDSGSNGYGQCLGGD